MKKLFIGFCLCIFILPLKATAQDLIIRDLQVATSIEDRQPLGVDTAFTADIGSVFCFTQVEGADNATKIFQVWYHKDEEKARIELDIESNQWRTWGSTSIMQTWTGPWRVMIEDINGNVLATTSFHIQEKSNSEY